MGVEEWQKVGGVADENAEDLQARTGGMGAGCGMKVKRDSLLQLCFIQARSVTLCAPSSSIPKSCHPGLE